MWKIRDFLNAMMTNFMNAKMSLLRFNEWQFNRSDAARRVQVLRVHQIRHGTQRDRTGPRWGITQDRY